MIEIRITVTSNIFLPFISFHFFLLTGPSTLAIAILRPVYCNTIFNEQRWSWSWVLPARVESLITFLFLVQMLYCWALRNLWQLRFMFQTFWILLGGKLTMIWMWRILSPVTSLRKQPTFAMPPLVSPPKWSLRKQCKKSILETLWVVLLIGWSKFPAWPANQKHYPDLDSDVISIQLLHLFLRRHFTGKQVEALWNDGLVNKIKEPNNGSSVSDK